MELNNVSSTTPMEFASGSFSGVGSSEFAGLSAPQATLAAQTPITTKLIAELFTEQNFTLFSGNPTLHTDGSFYALGAALGQAAAVPANSGAGAAYMTVVTGQGSTVSIVGRIAGETGTAGTALTLDVGSFSSRAVELTPFAYTATAPEPTTLTALGAIAFAGARRSRRAVRA